MEKLKQCSPNSRVKVKIKGKKISCGHFTFKFSAKCYLLCLMKFYITLHFNHQCLPLIQQPSKPPAHNLFFMTSALGCGTQEPFTSCTSSNYLLPLLIFLHQKSSQDVQLCHDDTSQTSLDQTGYTDISHFQCTLFQRNLQF